MADYLKQKASPGKDAIDFLEKERSFNKGLQDLKSSQPEMVSDFQRAVSKDLPVEKINKLGDIQPIKSGGDFMADQIIRDADKAARRGAVEQVGNTLNYKDLRKEFAAKNALKGKKLSLGGLLAGAAALGATALPDSAQASVPVQAGLRALDEGDPTSFLMPGEVGNADEELELLNEIKARQSYDKSPAAQARLQALKNIK